jgi:hypothetical protein
MSNHLTARLYGLAASRRGAWLAIALVIGLLLPAVVFAQPITKQAKSGLYWILGRQTLIVTVTEAGDTDEASLVSVEIRDAANVVRASTAAANMVVDKPVRLSVTVPAGPAQQLRAIVTVSIPTSPDIHQPTISMEVFDASSLTVKTLPPCAVPIEQMPSYGGGAEGNCEGWHLTSPTSGAR